MDIEFFDETICLVGCDCINCAEEAEEAANANVGRVLPAWLLSQTKGQTKKKVSENVTKNERQEKRLSPGFSIVIDTDPWTFSITKLRDHCKIRKLKCSGSRNELVTRVIDFEKEHNYTNWPQEYQRIKLLEAKWVEWDADRKVQLALSRMES